MPLGGAMGLKHSWKGWVFVTCHCCVVYIFLTLQRPFTHSCRCIPSAGIANNWTAWAVGVIVFLWITTIRNVLDTAAKERQRPTWYTLWSCLLGLVNNHAQSLAWQVNMQKENLNYNSALGIHLVISINTRTYNRVYTCISYLCILCIALCICINFVKRRLRKKILMKR